jgi:CRP/FNR family transcriptional regulator, anaerobic regulatory protein
MASSGIGNGSGVATPACQDFSAVGVQHFAHGLGSSGERISLRAQQRLSRATMDRASMFLVREGVLALDVVPPGGHRQILDFLMRGDIVSASGRVFPLSFSLRSITASALICRTEASATLWSGAPENGERLLFQLQSQLTRRNLHQIMIGQLDTEARVASFLLMLALRSADKVIPDHLLELPMSRDDIADYLAMNHDTLSRIMMRFETLGVLRRISRHAVRLTDIDKLSLHTPIASLLLTVFSGPAPDVPHS